MRSLRHADHIPCPESYIRQMFKPGFEQNEPDSRTFVSTTILSIWQRGVRIDPVMYDKSLITKTVVLE